VLLSEHYHDCHQLIYVVRGELEVTVGHERYAVRDGSLLILSRFESHAIRVVSRDCERYALSVSPDAAPHGNTEQDALSSVLVNRSSAFRHVVDMGRRAAHFEALLQMLTAEFRSRSPMREEMLALYLQQILIELCRQVPQLLTEKESDSMVLVRRLQSRMESDYAESFTLADLAAEMHVSPSHLSHLFKRVTGYAPMEYLAACRLSVAKRLLCTTASPVREIVERCGFTDESNFCRTFRQLTGMTPTEFRRAHGEGRGE
jgi:AraC-like DNA-binding protein